MKVLLPSLFVALALPCTSLALDLAQIPENDPDALKKAVEDEGGSVAGEPYIMTETGPEGSPVRLFVFPTPGCFVSLPVTPQADYWTMTGWIRIDEQPYGKSGGPIFGLLFGPNDCVLALSADRWSKAGAPALWSGSAELLNDEEIKASGIMEGGGEWQKIFLSIDGDAWKLQIGDSFERSGTVEGDTRGGIHRKGTLFMRSGNYGGAATIPVLTE